jgi:hypothetical protein
LKNSLKIFVEKSLLENNSKGITPVSRRWEKDSGRRSEEKG